MQGKSPLHTAVIEYSSEAVEALLEAGALDFADAVVRMEDDG